MKLLSFTWAPAFLPAFAIILGGCGPTGSGYGPGHAKVSLISEKKSFLAGQEAVLAVRFDIEPGWHLYWNGRNDTGYAPRITLNLPQGFQAGELQWPVPKRLISPGHILDHVYEHEVTLLLPVRVPANAISSKSYKIQGEASWLACHEVCVPGSGPVELQIHIANGQAEEPDPSSVEAISRAKSLLPGSDLPGHVVPSWEDSTLVFNAGEATRVMFFPDTSSVEIADLLQMGEVHGSVIRLTPKQPAATGEISGILGIEIPPDTLYFSVRVPLPRQP